MRERRVAEYRESASARIDSVRSHLQAVQFRGNRLAHLGRRLAHNVLDLAQPAAALAVHRQRVASVLASRDDCSREIAVQIAHSVNRESVISVRCGADFLRHSNSVTATGR